MNATNDVHFCFQLAIIFFYDVEHIIHTQFPSFFALRIEPRIRTEMTGEHTNIRGLNMKIAVEKSMIAVKFFAHKIGERSYKRKICFFKKHQAFLLANSLATVNFFCYALKLSA